MILTYIKMAIIIILGGYIFHYTYVWFLRPWIVEIFTEDIEINPKWLTTKLQSEYYGLSDIDIVLVRSVLGAVPRFRLRKNKQLQLLIDEDTSTKDIEKVAQIALAGKLKIKYGVWYPNKPTYWLSVLCFMLDGGEIKLENAKWEKKNEIEE